MFEKITSLCAAAVILASVLCQPANAAAPARPGRSEAITFSRQMGVGWNLGNTLEATGGIKGTSVSDYETAWGNPVTTKAMIDGIKASGFKSLRIPVAWSNMMGPNYVIDKGLMTRVAQVANYARRRHVCHHQHSLGRRLDTQVLHRT